MRIPVIHGVIERRILVNYRVRPDVLENLLPDPFRPQVVKGWGIAGICLIRLRGVRPWFLPGAWGISSENAAHRIAVEWDGLLGVPQRGVYVPRRDTSSRFNELVGGRLFPGVHHRARFDVRENAGRYHVELNGGDGTHVLVEGHEAERLPEGSIFRNLDEVSEFFRCGSLGYSPTFRPGEFDGLELRTLRWEMQPLAIERVVSSFFDDRERFPEGSVEFDSAVLMREIPHEWHGREMIRVANGSRVTACC